MGSSREPKLPFHVLRAVILDHLLITLVLDRGGWWPMRRRSGDRLTWRNEPRRMSADQPPEAGSKGPARRAAAAYSVKAEREPCIADKVGPGRRVSAAAETVDQPVVRQRGPRTGRSGMVVLSHLGARRWGFAEARPVQERFAGNLGRWARR